MDIGNNISNASVYTDFNELSRLRADAASEPGSDKANETSKKVAGQIEALFFQMVLKSMRDANSIGDSSESEQTRFYQDMFDKQITLELAQNNKGNGSGLAAMIEQQISGSSVNAEAATGAGNLALVRDQIKLSTMAMPEKMAGFLTDSQE